MTFIPFTDCSKNINVKILENGDKIDEITRSKAFRGRTILDEDVVAVSTTPEHVNRFVSKFITKSAYFHMIFSLIAERRPLLLASRYLNSASFICIAHGMTEYAKHGLTQNYWQQIQIGIYRPIITK